MFNRKSYMVAALLAVILLMAGFFLVRPTTQAEAQFQTGTLAATGQSGNAATLQPTVKVAERFDVSPALRTLKPQLPVPGSQDGDADHERSASGKEVVNKGYSKDTVVQTTFGALAPAIPTPLISFEGDMLRAGTPPDPTGDVSANYYVQMVNTSLQIFDKTGTSLYGPALIKTLFAGFGGSCETRNDGDPVVVHDQFADRWVLTQFTAAAPFYNCVAVSTTSDPTGTYYRYAFPVGNGANFGDYEKVAVWSDAYYISTREFQGSSGPFQGVGAYALNRAQMIAGVPNASVISFLAPPGIVSAPLGDGLLPADLDGSTLPPAGSPEYFAGTSDDDAGADMDAIGLWQFHVDFATPANSTFAQTNRLPTAPFDSIFPCSPTGRDCIPQLGTTQKIDILSYRQRPTFRLAYRNFGDHESLVTSQSVEALPNTAGMRWYELRSPRTNPVIFQQGTYAPADGLHRWMGSVAMDGSGNMALGYSVSSSTIYPAIRYTGRLASDPLGTMPQGEASIVEGGSAQTGISRWGDYTQMAVDPSDDCTFWYVNEYYPTGATGSSWHTRIGAFKFPQCVAGGNTATPTATGTLPTSTRTTTSTQTPVATATATTICGTVINEGFETGLGVFTSTVGTCAPSGCGWSSVTTAAHTGTHSAFAPDLGAVSDQYLSLTTAINVPASGGIMTFWHKYDTENTFDGGVLETSINGGTTWVDAGPNITSGGYNGTISSSYQSPISGRQAWTGTNGAAFTQVSVNLNPYSGQSLKIRFREANDSSVGATGWFVDDVQVSFPSQCGTATSTTTGTPPTATRTATGTPTCSPGGGGTPGPWATSTVGPSARYRHGGASDGTSVYVYGGGTSTGTYLNDLWKWNPTTQMWTQLANMPTGKQNIQGAYFNGKLYVPGGYTGTHIAENAIYDIASNTWSTGAPEPAIRSGATAAYNGKIYVFGGNPGPSAQTLIYTIATDTWSTGADMPVATTYGRAITAGNFMYYVGGIAAATTNAVYRYDPAANTWATMAPLQTARATAELMTNGTSIFAVNGGDSTFFTGVPLAQSVEIYNIAANTWTYGNPVVSKAAASAGGLAQGKIMIQGGVDNTIYYDQVQVSNLGSSGPCATSTSTSVVPTVTRTSTSVATGTGTSVATRTSTAVSTGTSIGTGTVGSTITAVATFTPAATNTSQPTSTTVPPTACPIQFQDVAADNTFYSYVRCLACKGILGGYPCGGTGEPCGTTNNPYFRPGVSISRGQIAKIVSQSAGFNEAPGTQIYEDVPMASPFYDYINRLSNRGYIGGYPCGQLPSETCITPNNRPYFRPSSNATRGQLSKIVATAAMITDPVSGQIYTDVGTDSPFYKWIQQLSARGVMSGYPCGGAGEPCDSQNRPYFRPNADVTRGQASKIVANTFFPNCQDRPEPTGTPAPVATIPDPTTGPVLK